MTKMSCIATSGLAVAMLALSGLDVLAAEGMKDMKRFVPGLMKSVVTITTKALKTPEVAGATRSTSEASASNFNESFGTGFVVDPSGYIVTNRHVIDNAYDVIVTFNEGTKLSAKVVGKGRRFDLAVLKVTPITPLAAVRWGDSDTMDVGDPVFAIGNPFGLGLAVSSGIVSGLNRNLHFSMVDEFIQTDAAINHGNSGGPLFNDQGEVIGINTALYSTNEKGGAVGIGYAIPSSDARELVPILERYGYLRVGSLLVDFQQVTPDLANALGVERHGAIVAAVDPTGPAANALKIGDIVEKVDEADVQGPRDLYRTLGQNIDKTLHVSVWRRGQTLTFDLVPAQAPEEAPLHLNAMMATPPAQASETMRLGAYAAPLTDENRKRFNIASDESGILVTGVLAGTPSAAAGLSVGDVIEALQMDPLKTPADAARIIDQADAEHRQFVVGLIKSNADRRFVTVPLQIVNRPHACSDATHEPPC